MKICTSAVVGFLVVITVAALGSIAGQSAWRASRLREIPLSSVSTSAPDFTPATLTTPNVDARPVEPAAVRWATFNCSLNRAAAGQLAAELASPECLPAQQIANIIQIVRPQILLLNEFDYDESGEALSHFRKNYLQVSQGGAEPITYEYVFADAVNTGVDSGLDLNGDGVTGSPDDAWGYGRFPGQYGMVVLSQFPIDVAQIRTFQKFLWRDLPGANWPVNPETGAQFYDATVREALRMSSKSHWDVPIKIRDQTVHFLVCHPTPPVFDGPEDRNGCRNYDEIRFWVEYLKNSPAIVDDRGQRGGLTPNAPFVIAGDLNADPQDGDQRAGAVAQLLQHPALIDSQPRSLGGVEQARLQGLKNREHRGDPSADTGDFNDEHVGNLRVDYVLPSRHWTVRQGAVFWPASQDPQFSLIEVSDHRLVWLDCELTVTGQ